MASLEPRVSRAAGVSQGAAVEKRARKWEVVFRYWGTKSVPSLEVVPKRVGVWRREWA